MRLFFVLGRHRLNKVGWIFAHPPREEGFLFSSSEVISAATLQLEAADGINDTPFVTVKVSSGFEATSVWRACPIIISGARSFGGRKQGAHEPTPLVLVTCVVSLVLGVILRA